VRAIIKIISVLGDGSLSYLPRSWQRCEDFPPHYGTVHYCLKTDSCKDRTALVGGVRNEIHNLIWA